MTTCSQLAGTRVLLVNPRTFPYDLRGEMHAPDQYKNERAINHGLLVIASILAHTGADVEVIDLDAELPEEAERLLDRTLVSHKPHIVGTGIISVYQYLSARQVLETGKAAGAVTMLGGQSSGAFAQELLSPTSPCDYLFRGDADETIVALITALKNGETPPKLPGVATRGDRSPSPAVVNSLEMSSNLEYELYPAWRSHFPLVEESRACPFKCSFCANEVITGSTYRGKSADLLIAEVERAIDMWGGASGSPVVLQCAIFGTHAATTEEFLRSVRRSRVEPRFLAALRVDNHWERYVELAGGCFDQVHFGFESGSLDLLARMIKTKNPHSYLDRSQAAFRAFHAQGVHVGINLIFGYYGETFGTVADTLGFILTNRDNIDSVWGGPFVLYPETPAKHDLDRARAEFGSDIISTSDFCDVLHTFPVTPSKTFSHQDSIDTGQMVMKIFNTRRKYYEHYRWYVGPAPGEGLSFRDEDAFYTTMFGDAIPADLLPSSNIPIQPVLSL